VYWVKGTIVVKVLWPASKVMPPDVVLLPKTLPEDVVVTEVIGLESPSLMLMDAMVVVDEEDEGMLCWHDWPAVHDAIPI
jgi:hypothetical protein